MYINRIKITKHMQLKSVSRFLLHYLFINTPTFASQGFVICRSRADQRPLASKNEISQGSNNVYLRIRMEIYLHVFVFEFLVPLSL